MMKTRSTTYRSSVAIVLAPAALLVVPWVAMRYTSEVAWTPSDFVAAAGLLCGAGFLYVLATREAGTLAHRVASGAAVLSALALLWINLAVGVVGNEHNPANLMVLGVLAIGVTGALVARFRPQGMARTLFAMAAAQAIVAVIAVFTGDARDSLRSVSASAGPSVLFVALFAGSALLYRRVAREQEPAARLARDAS